MRTAGDNNTLDVATDRVQPIAAVLSPENNATSSEAIWNNTIGISGYGISEFEQLIS
jgi:hypothetical protein